MQEGNRYQLQTALEMFKKIYNIYWNPWLWNSLKRHTVKQMLKMSCLCIEMVRVLWSLTSVRAQETTQGNTVHMNHLQQHVKHCEESHI